MYALDFKLSTGQTINVNMFLLNNGDKILLYAEYYEYEI